jgi:hypothetical protein
MAKLVSPTMGEQDVTFGENYAPGCPMLIRAAADHPTRVGDVLMRCALGWSIHDAVDCARCAATNAVQDCWRVHPERTPAVAVGGDPEPVESIAGQYAAD